MTLVVIGTGTDVGKTVVSALVAARFGAAAAPVTYWKPVATGARPASAARPAGAALPAPPAPAASPDGAAAATASAAAPDRDAATIADLAGERVAVLPETYLFDEPLSPHLAARLAGRRVDPAVLLADFDRHRAAAATAAATAAALLVETAGGILVPLTEEPAPGLLQADLLVAMAARAPLSCLLVARSELGTINHTLLTLEALRTRRLPLAGVVMNGPPNPENRRAIERFGGVGPLHELAPLVPLDRATLTAAAATFDPAGDLVAALAAS